MDKLKKFLIQPCQESIEKCFGFIKPQHPKSDYDLVGSPLKTNEVEAEDHDDWGTGSNIYNKNKDNTAIEVPLATVKKPVLIGNIDEDNLKKKNDVMRF